MAARIGGDYNDYCNLLKADHLKNGRNISGTVLVIDSYDGTLHSNRRNGDYQLFPTAHKC